VLHPYKHTSKVQTASFKVVISFPMHYFPQQNSLRNKKTCIIIIAYYKGICAEFERKTKQH